MFTNSKEFSEHSRRSKLVLLQGNPNLCIEFYRKTVTENNIHAFKKHSEVLIIILSNLKLLNCTDDFKMFLDIENNSKNNYRIIVNKSYRRKTLYLMLEFKIDRENTFI